MSMSFNRRGCREETKMSKPRAKGQSFAIPRRMVWEAWRQVKANKGAPGVHGQALQEFEADLRNNLYKVWNRRSELAVQDALRANAIPLRADQDRRMQALRRLSGREMPGGARKKSARASGVSRALEIWRTQQRRVALSGRCQRRRPCR
jgi:hypothetical protein